jgi:hypothetical protein
MLEIGTRVGAVVASAALALLMAMSADSAFANSVVYAGQVTSGQTRVLLVFDLSGAHCPNGPHCFDHAKVSKFGAVNFAYPDCPNVLEGAYEFGNPNTGQPGTVKVDKHQGFSGHGDADNDNIITGSFHGRFLNHGSKARGWLEVENEGCLTGKLNWTATPGGR